MTTGYDVIWSWAAKSKAWDAATSSASRTAWTKENRRNETVAKVRPIFVAYATKIGDARTDHLRPDWIIARSALSDTADAAPRSDQAVLIAAGCSSSPRRTQWPSRSR